MLEDVPTPTGVLASSESSAEKPQWIPDNGSNQGKQCLPSAQLSTPLSRTPTSEDWQAEE